MSRKYIWFTLIFAGALILDIVTKQWVHGALAFRDGFAVTSFFNIVHARNPGAAFGFLANADAAWRIPFFLLVGAVAVSVIIFLVIKAGREQLWYVAGLSAILGGAMGNTIDRVRYGYVVDFLDVHVGGWHWPAFNVADIALVVGAGILLLDALGDALRERRDKRSHSDPARQSEAS